MWNGSDFFYNDAIQNITTTVAQFSLIYIIKSDKLYLIGCSLARNICLLFLNICQGFESEFPKQAMFEKKNHFLFEI